MNTYVVEYNSISNGNSLLYGYENIEGKTPLEALKNRFGVEFRRLTGDAGRYAEIIISKGTVTDQGGYPIIKPCGKYQRLCYERVQ